MSDRLIVAAGAAAQRRDPLAGFEFQCDGQREALRFFFAGEDTHARCANQAGKTTIGCAGIIALAQGRESLGTGEFYPPLVVPAVPQPSTWWVVVKTRRQQVDAAQKAYLQWIGDWPHVIAYAARGLDYIENIRIKPHDWHSDDPDTWSKIAFHCEGVEGASLPGGRVNGAHGDEPPLLDTWSEVRARGLSNQTLYRIITETPIKQAEWGWLRDSDAGFKGCLGIPRRGRVEVTWKLSDVRCHSREYVAQLLESYRGDPRYAARANGDYVNIVGSNPFDWTALEEWERRCVPPKRVDVIPILGEQDGQRSTAARLEVWEDFDPRETYQLVVDPSGGIADGDHDPYGLQVHALRSPRLVARSSGYLDPWSLGLLTDAVGRRYGSGRAHVEVNRYGDTTIAALRSRRYLAIGRQESLAYAGKVREQYGFAQTEQTKWQAIAAIQQALLRGGFACPSAEVVRQLKDVQVIRTESGNETWVSEGADPRHHGEDVICLGWGLRQMSFGRVPAVPHESPPPPPPQHIGELVARDLHRRKRSRDKERPAYRWR